MELFIDDVVLIKNTNKTGYITGIYKSFHDEPILYEVREVGSHIRESYRIEQLKKITSDEERFLLIEKEKECLNEKIQSFILGEITEFQKRSNIMVKSISTRLERKDIGVGSLLSIECNLEI